MYRVVALFVAVLFLAPTSVQAKALLWCAGMGMLAAPCCGDDSHAERQFKDAPDKVSTAPCCIKRMAIKGAKLPVGSLTDDGDHNVSTDVAVGAAIEVAPKPAGRTLPHAIWPRPPPPPAEALFLRHLALLI